MARPRAARAGRWRTSDAGLSEPARAGRSSMGSSASDERPQHIATFGIEPPTFAFVMELEPPEVARVEPDLDIGLDEHLIGIAELNVDAAPVGLPSGNVHLAVSRARLAHASEIFRNPLTVPGQERRARLRS